MQLVLQEEERKRQELEQQVRIDKEKLQDTREKGGGRASFKNVLGKWKHRAVDRKQKSDLEKERQAADEKLKQE